MLRVETLRAMAIKTMRLGVENLGQDTSLRERRCDITGAPLPLEQRVGQEVYVQFARPVLAAVREGLPCVLLGGRLCAQRRLRIALSL
eukprot:5540941-Pleurochrysis_carterae.AAC.1